jgi:hypothetical protein
MKLAVRKHQDVTYIYYWCSGCKHAHSVPTERWNWNGSTELPTLSPSVRHFVPAGTYGDGVQRPEQTLCHYFLRDGIIEYCSDCPHEFNGQKVALQEIPDDYGIPDNT